MIKIMRKLLVFVFVFVSLYSNSQSICGGSSTTLQATNPQNLTGPSYSLNPGGFSSNGGTFVISPNATTTYTLYTTGQNTANVATTTSVVTTVTVNAQPHVAPTFTQASCTSSLNAINLGLSFSPSSPASAYTISWTPLPGSVLSPQQTTATALTPGPYTLAVTAAAGCSTVINFTMLPQPAPAVYSVIPFGSTHSITCVQPTLQLNATNTNLTYTWSSTSFSPVVSDSIFLSSVNVGTLSVVGQNTVSNCISTFTFQIAQNVSVPSATISTNLINITCSQSVAPTVSVIASPTVNIGHFIYSPQGGTFAANSYTAIYIVGGPGTYTHCAVDNSNGCSSCRTFTVATSDNYPTFNVSSPQNFTLGCSTKSVATINIVGGATTPTPGGPISYTIIGPPTSTTIPTGSSTLSGISNYTVSVPGTWTVITKDNTNFCVTSTPISIIQNTFTPDISANVPLQILDCTNTVTILQGQSVTSNVIYNWAFVGTPGNVNGSTITVNTIPGSPSQTVINTYTLSITDNNNKCVSYSVIPVYQDVFLPKTGISNGGINALTCSVPTLVLTNNSSTGITGNFFPAILPVVGYLWEGPTPQDPLQVNSTYVAATVGTYTLTGKDLNNGCISTATISIADNKNYPTINAPPVVATASIIDCGASSVSLSPVYIGSPLSYSWTAPTATSIVGSGSVAALAVKFPGSYTVVATNTLNGCTAKGVMTAINGSLTAAFVASADSGYAPLSVTFTNNSTSSNNTNSITSAWSFGNGASMITTSGSTLVPQALYTLPGTFVVSMFVTKGACLDTVRHAIKVEVPSELEVPNVFTPNNDKVNDLFFLKATHLSEINMVIYDRWGHIVYELISSVGNVEWDGKNQQGKDSAEGTYFYTLKATGTDGQSYNKKGTISLMR
jgi:gliding motility-associated-like protein